MRSKSWKQLHQVTRFRRIVRKAAQLSSFFWEDSFLCGPFVKSLLNLLQCCFCFMSFGPRDILDPRRGIKPGTPAVEGDVITTGPPGKPLLLFFLICLHISHSLLLQYFPGCLIPAPGIRRPRELGMACPRAIPTLETKKHLVTPRGS